MVWSVAKGFPFAANWALAEDKDLETQQPLHGKSFQLMDEPK